MMTKVATLCTYYYRSTHTIHTITIHTITNHTIHADAYTYSYDNTILTNTNTKY